MLLDIAFLIVALLVILAAAELFTNGVEWLGQRLSVSEGVVGSVFAAIGTALPETLIPFVAIFFFGARHGHEVGIGAIAGAPFMLSTLTLALCGLTVKLCSISGKRSPEIRVNSAVIERDLGFFIVSYAVAVLASVMFNDTWMRQALAIVLLATYALYIYKTFKHEGEVGAKPETLHFARIFKARSRRLKMILPQILAGLFGITGGAFLFVNYVEALSRSLDVPPLILSLIISPIATELPEKINSVLWARQGKDTLALGNVTGALVFQSCIPVAFGMAFTEWNLGYGTLITAGVALTCCSMYFGLLKVKKLQPTHLMFGAAAYAATLAYMLMLQPKS